jgi:DNA-binding NarL/FixJ family response regulator
MVVELIAKGYSSKAIAERLHISLLTVQTHRRNMLRKLKLHNSHQLIAWAYKNQLLHNLIPWTLLLLTGL